MGFRDFECFNSTLLAKKQLWRILTRPYSLAIAILKEKYFKFFNLMDALRKVTPLGYEKFWYRLENYLKKEADGELGMALG